VKLLFQLWQGVSNPHTRRRYSNRSTYFTTPWTSRPRTQEHGGAAPQFSVTTSIEPGPLVMKGFRLAPAISLREAFRNLHRPHCRPHISATPRNQTDKRQHRFLSNTGNSRPDRHTTTMRKFLLILRRWDRDPGGPPVVPTTLGSSHEFVPLKSHILSFRGARNAIGTGQACLPLVDRSKSLRIGEKHGVDLDTERSSQMTFPPPFPSRLR
jgi:hypothetical protein